MTIGFVGALEKAPSPAILESIEKSFRGGSEKIFSETDESPGRRGRHSIRGGRLGGKLEKEESNFDDELA